MTVGLIWARWSTLSHPKLYPHNNMPRRWGSNLQTMSRRILHGSHFCENSNRKEDGHRTSAYWSTMEESQWKVLSDFSIGLTISLVLKSLVQHVLQVSHHQGLGFIISYFTARPASAHQQHNCGGSQQHLGVHVMSPGHRGVKASFVSPPGSASFFLRSWDQTDL